MKQIYASIIPFGLMSVKMKPKYGSSLWRCSIDTLTDKLSEIKDSADTLSEVDFIHQQKQLTTEVGTELHDKFDTILKIAHADYDKNKNRKICWSKRLLPEMLPKS